MESEEFAEIRRRLDGIEQRLAQLEGGGARVKGGLSRLSETERRIVGLVAAGHTNEEVAQRLFLSPKTVEWSLTKIYRKLLVRSRTELAAKLAPAASLWENFRETPGRTLSGSRSEAQAEDEGETS